MQLAVLLADFSQKGVYNANMEDVDHWKEEVVRQRMGKNGH